MLNSIIGSVEEQMKDTSLEELDTWVNKSVNIDVEKYDDFCDYMIASLRHDIYKVGDGEGEIPESIENACYEVKLETH
jgi:hypothetical protein